jgi:hypothetical protein
MLKNLQAKVVSLASKPPAFPTKKTRVARKDELPPLIAHFPFSRYISLLGLKIPLLLFTLFVLPRSSLPLSPSSVLSFLAPRPKTSLDRPEWVWLSHLTVDPLATAGWVVGGVIIVAVWWSGEMAGFWETEEERKRIEAVASAPVVPGAAQMEEERKVQRRLGENSRKWNVRTKPSTLSNWRLLFPASDSAVRLLNLFPSFPFLPSLPLAVSSSGYPLNPRRISPFLPPFALPRSASPPLPPRHPATNLHSRPSPLRPRRLHAHRCARSSLVARRISWRRAVGLDEALRRGRVS